MLLPAISTLTTTFLLVRCISVILFEARLYLSNLGERLMKEVYELVRNGPLWEKTLLIITYDEHGGYWDHVPPPQVLCPLLSLG
jgi:phospholipase C